ncbi:LuxR family two component transcriptional regulator [Candidatus Methylomirabilis lanthanidiphila]|uniref:LuxR family two component transcriptional regulator n=1 Tax=Candidatus Methylomirabilis lanthanidiphila TaxID=2211376 RepID=A0A564ZI57_9BACT|nr:response regulator transcription factor [Candidatus Methylomirabilis lanthanidiphila]VUZ84843.1 LuxR family two component transcriptional regulator [Candidatus Methylomirabilis lanthanidiphila]
MASIRIVIAEGDPGFREGFCEHLRLVRDFEIVGEACDGREAIASMGRLDPDILILDLDLPPIDGMDVLRVVGWFSPKTQVIIQSGHAEESTILEALELGARGYIVRGGEIDLEKAIRVVRQGEVWVGRRVLARVLDRLIGVGGSAFQVNDDERFSA